MFYKGQTILVSHINNKAEEITEVGIFLGIQEDEESVFVYTGKSPDDPLIDAGKDDIGYIADKTKDGGILWGNCRSDKMSGLWGDKKVVISYKEFNKEISRVKGIITRRKNKLKKDVQEKK